MNTDAILLVAVLFIVSLVWLSGLLFRHHSDVIYKKLLAYSLIVVVLSGVMGAAMTRLSSQVYVFYCLAGLSLVFGILSGLVSRRTFSWLAVGGFWSELLFSGFIVFLAETSFVGFFRWLSRSEAFMPSLMLGFLPFFLPLLVNYSLRTWLAIPPKIYRKWFYPVARPVPLIEPNNPIRLNFMVTKKPDAPVSSRFTVSLPQNRTLDEIFQYMIYSHNFEEDPEHPIEYHEENTEGTLLGWVFYQEKYWGWSKQFLNPAETLSRNGLKQNDSIIARSFSND